MFITNRSSLIFKMRTIMVTVLLSICTLSKCHQKICLKYSSLNLSSLQNSTDCLVEAEVLSEPELINLGKQCNSYRDGVINLKWPTFQNTEITGFESFATLCKNHTLGQFSWISWNMYKNFIQNNELLKDSFLVTKFEEPWNEDICNLDTKTGDCQLLQDESKVAKSNLYVLTERKPIRYELRNMNCKEKTVTDAPETPVHYTGLNNPNLYYENTTQPTSYSFIRAYKFNLDAIPLVKNVSIQLYTESGVAKSDADDWFTEEVLVSNSSLDMKPSNKSNVFLGMKPQTVICNITIDLIRIYDNYSNDSTNIMLKGSKILLQIPEDIRVPRTECYKSDKNITNGLISIGAALGVILLLICVALCINSKSCSVDPETALCCLWCGNCCEVTGSCLELCVICSDSN